MDDVNKEKPMEFWLHFHCAKYRRRRRRHSNGFIVALLLMIHLISMAWCDRTDTKRAPPFERNHNRHSFNVTTFNWRQWQSTVAPDTIAIAPTAPVVRTKWIDAPQPISRLNVNVNDQRNTRLPVDLPWNSRFKSNAQRKVYYGVAGSVLHGGSEVNLEQQRWNNVTERWPITKINQHNQIPKNKSPNLLTNQLNTNNAINSVHTNTIRMNDGTVKNRELYEFNVKLSAQRNCAKCRILPGVPIRSKSYFSTISVSGMCFLNGQL